MRFFPLDVPKLLVKTGDIETVPRRLCGGMSVCSTPLRETGLTMKSFSATPKDIKKEWILIDADGVVLGRLASRVANILRGKHKATYTPHMDCGDNVVIINAEKVRLTGNKRDTKTYYWHTGHPGGIKERTANQILDGDYPERVLTKAIERMIPRGPLGRRQMKNLRVYAGPEHKQEAQSPRVYDFGAENPKNVR